MRYLFITLSLIFSVSCSGPANNSTIAVKATTTPTSTPPRNGPVPVYGYEVVRSYPHDPKAFTQGLLFQDGSFYESDGEYGESAVRKVDIATGKTLLRKAVPDEYFAEGLTALNNKLYQITWREKTAFVYSLNDLTLERQIKYAGDGWGLTNDGTNLILSDGTNVIRFVDPENMRTVRTITVNREDGRPLKNLNELEMVKGEIWSNIWHSEDPDILGKPNTIARIDPGSGALLGWIDLSGISPDDQPKADKVMDEMDPKSENTLNGIAYDAANDRIFVTGKNWKKLYEIKLTAPKQ